MAFLPWLREIVLSSLLIFTIVVPFVATSATDQANTGDVVSVDDFDKRVTGFLGREIAAHVADLNSLSPPQPYVVGARTGGEFTWGTFMRAVASYSALAGDTTLAGKDLPKLIGQLGLIEADRGGKTFAQLYAAISLRQFGTNLQKNAVWKKLTPQEQVQWRSLLDPGRFYDRNTRHVINLPENYFGVAARIVAIDYQLGLITDRRFVDAVLDRAAQQFTEGNLYSDDGLPAGRYDRYSNEYARYVYLAAEDVGRKDLQEKLTSTLVTQMRTWWDLLSPDGYGYPWGRSLGAISYEDTLEIVAFLATHPQFRPARLTELASAYYAAWNWLENDFKAKPHLLNVFGYGRGNYNYITPEREWQQTAAFFGKASGAHRLFIEAIRKEGVTSFPGQLNLPEVARFEFFRKGDRPAGVWLVRRPGTRFALPIVAGTRAGISDYLPAPYSLPGFAAPTEQIAPVLTPYLELEDGRTVVASDAADEIIPSTDGMSLSAVWKRWAIVGAKPGQPQDVGLTSKVTWRVEGNRLLRTESISLSQPVKVRKFWVIVPSTCDHVSTHTSNGETIADFSDDDVMLKATISSPDIPLHFEIVATGNSALGKSSRGAIPVYLEIVSKNVTISTGSSIEWNLVLQSSPSARVGDSTKKDAMYTDQISNPVVPASSVRYFPASAVQQSFASAGTLFKESGRPYSIITGHREKAGTAEVHLRDADLMYVVEGSATYVTGGSVVKPQTTAPDEIRGDSIIGGDERELSKGDVMIIPAGTPHWCKDVRGTFLYYLIKVR